MALLLCDAEQVPVRDLTTPRRRRREAPATGMPCADFAERLTCAIPSRCWCPGIVSDAAAQCPEHEAVPEGRRGMGVSEAVAATRTCGPGHGRPEALARSRQGA